ncbi:MAG: IS4 family transposase [Candidatus Hodarchaeales archaeon]|jgi:hypothetical protein
MAIYGQILVKNSTNEVCAMKAIGLLNNLLSNTCPTLHKIRKKALLSAVEAGARHHRGSVTGLGRSLKSLSKTQTKYDIKRMDRLVGNKRLHKERKTIYMACAVRLIGNRRHPLLLVDWSPVEGRDIFQVVRVSIPMGGRSLTIYEKIYPESKLANAKAHEELLDELEQILPPGCKPILISDAGFKAPWFRAVQAKGWYWLNRVRGNVSLSLDAENWNSCQEFFSQATNKAKDLGQILYAKSSRFPCQGTLYKESKKNRQKRKKRGGKSNCTTSKYQEKKANEPWLLIAHLPAYMKGPTHPVCLYKIRMQIEEGFRDTKNYQFGIGLSLARSTTVERYDNLFLIAALVLFVLWCIGRTAYQHGYHRFLQSNTRTTRAELSYIYIAIQIIDDERYQLCDVCLEETMRLSDNSRGV